MEFVNPGFLYGLLAIAIPIIIHLFNFRRYRKVYFSNVKLLKELQFETKRSSRLKHLVILMLRILAVAALVIAFARPYIPDKNNQFKPEESSAVVVYIDNSFSMAGESNGNVLLEEAKIKALGIVNSFKPSDRFQLICNDFKGVHQRFVSREDFIDFVEDLSVSPSVKKMSAIFEMAEKQLDRSHAVNKLLFLINDLQKTTSDLEQFSMDTLVSAYLIPLERINTNNVFIDSCWTDSPVLLPGQQVVLHARVRNASAQDLEKLPVNLYLNQKQKALASLDIRAGATAIADLNFSIQNPGVFQGNVEISDYPVSFDDNYFLSIHVSKELPVLEIYGKKANPFILALFGNDSSFLLEQQSIKQLDYSLLNDYQLVILSQLENIPSGLADALKRFVARGASVLIEPASGNLDYDSYNSLLGVFGINALISLDSSRVKVDYLNVQDPLFDDVFTEEPKDVRLPIVTAHYTQQKASRSLEMPLILLQNGDNFLSRTAYQQGNVFLFTSEFSATHGDFVMNPLFVPVLYKIALTAKTNGKLSYNLRNGKGIEVSTKEMGKDEILKLSNEEIEIIPEIYSRNYRTYINPHDQLELAGNYKLSDKNGSIDGISFNYKRAESDLASYSIQEIKKIFIDQKFVNFSLIDNQEASFVNNAIDAKGSSRLWKLFVIFALAFLMAEIAVIRLWK
jgi:aerotolerance regulator-like protein